MKKEKILKSCRDNCEKFKETIDNEEYQLRGIFNSEALLIVSIVDYFKVRHIIESGRARGHSTNIIAKFFKDNSEIKITSIDFDKFSEDAKYSEKYLSRYKNIEILYGDSNKMIVNQINQDCVVFIDGPKGNDAIQLAVRLLSDDRVKAVMLHDFHKNEFLRNVCEIIFKNYFFSDDKDFVELFRNLDDSCWEKLKDTDEAPYYRKGKKINSYASTLGVFFNSENPIRKLVYKNYLSNLEQQKPTLQKVFIQNISHDSMFYKISRKIYKSFIKR